MLSNSGSLPSIHDFRQQVGAPSRAFLWVAMSAKKTAVGTNFAQNASISQAQPSDDVGV